MQNKPSVISVSVFGRFVHILSALAGLWSVNIRQFVREQPDTGYRKSLLSYFATAPFIYREWGNITIPELLRLFSF